MLHDLQPAGLAAAAIPSAAASTVTAVPLDTGTLLLLLPAGAPPPAAGVIDGGLAWRAVLWPTPEGAVAGIGLIRAASAVPARLAGLAVRPQDSTAAWPLPEIGRLELEPEALAKHVLASGGDPASAFDLLRDGLPEGGAEGRARAFAQGYLAAVAQQDGFVEIIGLPEGGGLLLQGWALSLDAGPSEIGVVAQDLSIQSFAVACFDRPDLLPPARGFVAFAKHARPGRVESVRAVVARAGGRLLHLDVVAQNRLVLEGAAAVTHLAAMLPRLGAGPEVLRELRRVCRPRWQGRDTLAELDLPIGAAVDLALAVDGAGILLTGWLLDPERRVGGVFLKSTANAYWPLEARWTRLPRPDLLEGFARDPRFAGRLQPHDLLHGFIIFLPLERPPAADERFYLELVLEDEACAFLAVQPEPARAGTHLPRLLAGIALDEPELDRIVQDHLAPLVAALAPSQPAIAPLGPPIPLGTAAVRAGPLLPLPGMPALPLPAPSISAIVPIGAGWHAIEALLAQLGSDPDFRAVELVLVADRETARGHGRRLAGAVAFYGLRGALVLAAGPLDPGEALDLGARSAQGELLLCLAPSILPRQPGWLGRLVTGLERAPEAGLACPTLLYEDESIRFAGDCRPTAVPGPAGRLAGYPAGWLAETAPATVAHGPAECFLIRRALFLAAGGLMGGLIGPELRHLDLAARLRALGRACLWVPDVALWALDEPEPVPVEPWQRVARLVDRAVFERRRQAAAMAEGGER